MIIWEDATHSNVINAVTMWSQLATLVMVWKRSKIYTDIIIKMIEKDSLIIEAMNKSEWNRLQHFI